MKNGTKIKKGKKKFDAPNMITLFSAMQKLMLIYWCK